MTTASSPSFAPARPSSPESSTVTWNGRYPRARGGRSSSWPPTSGAAWPLLVADSADPASLAALERAAREIVAWSQ